MKIKGVTIIAVVLFLFVVLSGCQESSNQNEDHHLNNSTNNLNGNQQYNITDNEFLGDWEVVDSYPDFETWSFYENLSIKIYLTQEMENETYTTISWFDYTKDNTTICLSPKNESPGSPYYFSICYSYLLSENATRLTLSHNGVLIMDLIKI